jgi:6-pyruvoyltetrahydropterin/6-carboxytetrahydropterin synthase
MYRITKRYGHDEGWSCAFRQWQAEHSHCRFIHGYPLAFEFTYEAEELDAHHWVIDFGGLKPLKAWLQSQFDHKLLVAEDDPDIEIFMTMGEKKIADIVFVEAVGCEKFAAMAWCHANYLLMKSPDWPRVRLVSVTCAEHGGNSATITVP